MSRDCCIGIFLGLAIRRLLEVKHSWRGIVALKLRAYLENYCLLRWGRGRLCVQVDAQLNAVVVNNLTATQEFLASKPDLSADGGSIVMVRPRSWSWAHMAPQSIQHACSVKQHEYSRSM